jgi:hypothetical protein
MKHLVLLLTLLTGSALAHAQDIAGDWKGTLSAGGSELHLVLHIEKAADGSFKATLDSVDQGANGIPVNSISLKDSRLNLGVEAVHGTYEGKVAEDGKTISGTWSQGTPLPLNFTRVVAPTSNVKPSDIDGAWMGTLDTGVAKLRVVFHIVNTNDGLAATLDSPDQGVSGMPTSSVTRDGASLKIEAKKIGGIFEGAIAADLSCIDGKWSQGGNTWPLLLKRTTDKSPN